MEKTSTQIIVRNEAAGSGGDRGKWGPAIAAVAAARRSQTARAACARAASRVL